METINFSSLVEVVARGKNTNLYLLQLVSFSFQKCSSRSSLSCTDQVYSCYLRRYDIMLSCWEKSPDDRPTFEELFEILQEILNKNEVKFILINGSAFCYSVLKQKSFLLIFLSIFFFALQRSYINVSFFEE